MSIFLQALLYNDTIVSLIISNTGIDQTDSSDLKILRNICGY